MSLQYLKAPLKMAYSVSGQGPPLLLIHGLGLSRMEWKKNREAFEKEATVYALDLPGFGESEAPQGILSPRELAKSVHAFTEALALPPLVCMGHSLGSEVALWLAYLYPRQVKALILAAAPGCSPALPLWQRMVGLGLDACLEPPIFMHRLLWAYMQAGPRRILQTLQASDLRPIIQNPHRLALPIMLINGRYDTVVSIYEGNLWKQRLPQAELCIIPAAHGLNFANPEAFNACCRPFLLKHL